MINALDHAHSETFGRDSRRRPKVLLVEDAHIGGAVIDAMLASGGYAVTIAENGLEALDHVRQATFAAILMDVRMPVLDGLATTRAIRQLGGATGRTPIIGLTAAVTEPERAECFASGMNSCLAKPVTRQALLEELSSWVAA